MLNALAELRIRNSPIWPTLETMASLTGALLRIIWNLSVCVVFRYVCIIASLDKSVNKKIKEMGYF
jgi:hypothetical protein